MEKVTRSSYVKFRDFALPQKSRPCQLNRVLLTLFSVLASMLEIFEEAETALRLRFDCTNIFSCKYDC